MNPGTRIHNYILFAVSFVAAIWFFVAYPLQDPRSAAQLSFNKEEIELFAADKFSDLGFSLNNYTTSETSYAGNQALLDSLQYELGRTHATEALNQSANPNIKPFFWQVTFTRKGDRSNTQNTQNPFGPNPEEVGIRLDENGKFIGLVNPSEHLPQKNIQRSALGSVFSPSPDTLQPSVMTGVSDSLLNRMLYFDMQKQQEISAEYKRKPETEVRNNFDQGIPYRHSINDARALADYYLSQTGWNRSAFQVDTVFVKRIGSVNAANVRYSTKDSTLGQQLRIDAAVAPTGALLQMNASYDANTSQNGAPGLWEILHTILILLLILTGLVIFFFRMRSRAIDTQASLVLAVMMGLIVPILIFLERQINPFSSNVSLNESVILFLQMGIWAALSSVGFFVLFAISDSITRQHWPVKLSSYDYLRQGMLFNKPVGIALLRGIGLAFILAGFWTLALHFMPRLYFSFPSVFVAEQAAWPPLYLLFTNSWFSLAVICGIFLVVGSLAYGKSENSWLAGVFTILACALVVPFYKNFGPPAFEILQGALLGVVLTAIFIKWDFLTVFLAHFLFLGLVGSASGWIVPNSPDAFTFVVYMIFLAILVVAGCLAIFMGKEERTLPEYVPDYVEELAQEQRIKQELDIARKVQQSFLPSKIPTIAGLDVAAICQPAYETGGDYYDFIPLDDHRVAVAIGDVSGKGIQAAFYMTFVKGMLHSLCRETDSPAEVLRKTNRLFYENATKGTFVSLIYGIVDLKEKTFTFARAGHNPILHVHGSTGTIEELQPNGLGVGLAKGEIFDNKIEEIKLSLTDDDLFLLYTDGIVEALNMAHQFYGTENLIKVIDKQKHKSASEIVSSISKSVTNFIGKAKQHDDMTLMAISFDRT